MNYFPDFPIHKKIQEQFINSLANNRLAHAYLFYGPEGCGKEAFSFELAKMLNCEDENNRPCNSCPACSKIGHLNHPDLKYIFPTGATWKPDEISKKISGKAQNPFSRIELSGHTVIQIERIRELKNEAKYASYEAKKRFYIVSEAEKMSRESANSFLKLLEEPPENLIIILITSKQNTLLDTIRSRCRIVHFPVLSFEDASLIVNKYCILDEEIKKTIRMSQGNLKEFFDMIDKPIDEKRQLVYEYLKSTASGNALKLMTTVDAIAKKRDKNFLKEILNLLILWMKDSLYLVHFGKDSNIINVDFEEEIRKFAENYSLSNFDKIVTEIENAVQNLNRNVYNPLILTVLAFKIKQNLVQKTI